MFSFSCVDYFKSLGNYGQRCCSCCPSTFGWAMTTIAWPPQHGSPISALIYTRYLQSCIREFLWGWCVRVTLCEEVFQPHDLT